MLPSELSTHTPPRSEARSTFSALRHRDFQLFTAGQGVSLIGTWLQSLALSWLVYRLTHSTVLMGTVGFCSLIPVLLLGPIAGVVADRYSRRHIVIAMQSLMLVRYVTQPIELTEPRAQFRAQ